jgi:hypothetical protein
VQGLPTQAQATMLLTKPMKLLYGITNKSLIAFGVVEH